MRKPHPVVWTASRVQAWQETGNRPPVAVWNAAQTATFWAVCAVIRCTARLQAQALAQLAAAGEPVDRLGVARRAPAASPTAIPASPSPRNAVTPAERIDPRSPCLDGVPSARAAVPPS